jgi:uncharacterized tellurite resistance protein B-like protein
MAWCIFGLTKIFMTSVQNLYYAIGELAYAIAISDGMIQNEETKKFYQIVEAELRCKKYDFDIAKIIFQIMNKDKINSEDSYNRAMHQIRLNSHYLSPELKNTFIAVIEKVSRAFKPVTLEEFEMIVRFKNEIKLINGDPVYYNS